LWNCFHSSFPPSDRQVYLDWLRLCVPYSCCHQYCPHHIFNCLTRQPGYSMLHCDN
jgi:hypothetical protein